MLACWLTPAPAHLPQVCYCLKKGIGKMFLRRMLDGSLELGRSVLIVDEVDDLIA